MKLVDKAAMMAEIEKRYEYWREKEFNSHSIESEIRMSECQYLMLLLNNLEVKEVDLDKEKVENIKKQCPLREVVCSKYQNHPLKCSGACAFVSDRITLEKKHLHDIQNVPVDEERLKMDRRNTIC